MMQKIVFCIGLIFCLAANLLAEFRVTKEQVSFLDKNSIQEFMSVKYGAYDMELTLQEMLLYTNLIHKEGEIFVASSIDSIKSKGEAFKIKGFAHNELTNELILTGIWKKKTGNYFSTYTFVATYNADTKEFQSIAFAFCIGENDGVYLSKNGKLALFTQHIFDKYHVHVLDITTKKAVVLDNNRWEFITHIHFSNDGRYILGVSKYEYSKFFIEIYATQDGKKVNEIPLGSGSDSVEDLTFFISDDSKTFYYRTKVLGDIKGLNLETMAPLDSIALKDKDDYFLTMLFGNNDILIIYRYGIKKRDFSLYDIKANKHICQAVDDQSFVTHNFTYDAQSGIATGFDAASKSKAYLNQNGQCIGFLEEQTTQKIKLSDKVTFIGTNGYFFKDGAMIYLDAQENIQKVNIPKIEITPEKIEFAKDLLMLYKVKKLGFEAKTVKVLEKIFLQNSFDSWAKQSTMISVDDPYLSFVSGLAIRRYIAEKKELSFEPFQRAFFEYIRFVSQYGFFELEPEAIKLYKSLLDANPSQEVKEMLRLMEANYLLDIDKDEEAYELLFETAPFSDRIIKKIKNFSKVAPIGLFKNIEKLSLITNISESELTVDKKPLAKVLDFIYDMHGNKIQKGEKVPIKSKQQVVEKDNKKDNAIKLLE